MIRGISRHPKEAMPPLNTLPSIKRIVLIVTGTLLAGNILGGMITGGLEHNLADILLDAFFMTFFFLTLFYLFVYRPFIGTINDLRVKQDFHKAVEEKLQTLLDTMPDGVWFKDGDGRWLAVNKSGLALFGLENADYPGKRDSEQVPEGSFHFPALVHCQNTDKAAWDAGRLSRVEEHIPQPNGIGHTFDVLKVPLFNADGSRKGLVVLARDISQKEKLERARQYFADVTSHEMITPLSKLHMLKVMLANLRPYNTEPEKLTAVEEGLAGVYTDFKRIADLTSLLVQVSTPAVPGADRPFPLRPQLLNVVNRTITTIEAERRMVVMEVDIEALPIETLAMGDPGVLEAALREVLSNAVKFTKDGGIVRFSAASEKNEAVITVTDEGIGIPMDRLQEAFDPFFSLENPLHHSTGQFKFKGGGLGIGLTVAALAMRQIGGSLTLHSDGENKGTVVTLRLPLA